MPKNRVCVDCGNSCAGSRCQECNLEFRRRQKKDNARTCKVCGKVLSSGTMGDKCFAHRDYNHQLDRAQRILEEEAKVAPSLPSEPRETGDWLILSDTHIPFHHPGAIHRALKQAVRLGVRNCCVAGDLIHADIISKYANAGKLVSIADELVSCGRVLEAMLGIFDRIVVIMGNHDQRLEKLAARWQATRDGQHAMELLGRILDKSTDAESITGGILEHFFSSPRVKLEPLTSLVINQDWLVLHPGSCSRISPQTERKLAEKRRKSVVGGHNHLFGVGFDASGEDLAVNIGHLSDDNKFRYMREKITTFPTTVRGWGFILCSDKAPRGRFLPVADHPKWFDLDELIDRVGR